MRGAGEGARMGEPVVLVAAVAGESPLPAAAALAGAMIPPERAGDPAGAALLVDLTGSPAPRPSLLAADSARLAAADLPERLPGLRAVARGRLCVAVPALEREGDGGAAVAAPGAAHEGPPDTDRDAGPGADRDARPGAAADLLIAIGAAGLPAPLVVALPPPALRHALELLPGCPAAVLVQASPASGKPLLALLARELRAARVPVAIWRRRPGLIQRRRALAGLDPGGETAIRARRAARRLLGACEAGQALPAILVLILVTLLIGAALAAIGGAASAKGRAQRAADLAAVSAARSMRDDFHRLFLPATDPAGARNPAHLGRLDYLGRARAAAVEAAGRNGIPRPAVQVRWPDRESFAPVRVTVRARLSPRLRSQRPRLTEEASTTVRATAALAPTAAAADEAAGDGRVIASGGGYAGRLALRQGEGMRPDVAAAFDRLERVALAAGHRLIISSGFRSDAEQAALFAANPDPRWVAPPGRSLHRCATELDLGPASAHGWLGANAARFGFSRRYSWEPWHYGFVGPPAPCAAPVATRDRGRGSGRQGARGASRPDGRAAGAPSLPAFVPPRFRRPLLSAAARHGVGAALLAAQLLAESNFNPAAVSPAGARGIAQFMPGTAAAYGLADPFDPAASIDAQARLMRDLSDRFGAVSLALAAYNAGPGPVAACRCVPAYPETQAYVARILGLIGELGPATFDSAGAPGSSVLEVRLVDSI